MHDQAEARLGGVVCLDNVLDICMHAQGCWYIPTVRKPYVPSNKVCSRNALGACHVLQLSGQVHAKWLPLLKSMCYFATFANV